MLYLADLSDPTPQILGKGEVDQELTDRVRQCAEFVARDPGVTGLHVLPSWKSVARYLAQPSILAVYKYLEDLIGIFHLSATQNGVVNDCPYAVSVQGVSLRTSPSADKVIARKRGWSIATRAVVGATVTAVVIGILAIDHR